MISVRPFALELGALVFVLLLGGVVGLAIQEDERPYEVLEGDLEPLREAFNADPGHVRAVLLAAPT